MDAAFKLYFELENPTSNLTISAVLLIKQATSVNSDGAAHISPQTLPRY